MEQKNVMQYWNLQATCGGEYTDTLEDNGIDTILANPYKTKIIAQAKIKSDKLDAILIYKKEIPFTPLLN
jgi:hypothetical protein